MFRVRGLDAEYLHRADDNPRVRRRVFELIASHLNEPCINSPLAEKPKTGLALREDKRFYSEMLGHLLKFVLAAKEVKDVADEVIVITDTITVQKKRQTIEKAIQQALAKMPPAGMKCRILHHPSRSHCGLQMANYCCWAIFRKWQRGEIDIGI